MFELSSLLTPKEIQDCKEVAFHRVKIQVDDAKDGDVRASYSFGKAAGVGQRNLNLRCEDAWIGALGECIISKFAKCPWKKEIGQYKTHSANPDLTVVFQGKSFRCECRGTRDNGSFIYRERDKSHPNDILICVTNLPYGPTCKVGWAFFGRLTDLATAHSEWKGNYPGAPYWKIPIENLSTDFSGFGGELP